MDKLAVSNIAWTGNDAEIFELLASLGVRGVEVAPGKVAPWGGLNTKKMAAYFLRCQEYGLVIPSFQAFLFGKPELQLLGDRKSFEDFLEHVDFVAEMAQVAGAKVLVFGAPKNRLLLGNTVEEARLIALDRLRLLAEKTWKHGVSIGLEAVPATYGGELITSYRDSLEFVKIINHPGLVFHFDTGCTSLNGDDVALAIEQSGSRIMHFHISQPQLDTFSIPAEYHHSASDALKKVGYQNWTCIEMKETASPIESISNAINYVSTMYQ